MKFSSSMFFKTAGNGRPMLRMAKVDPDATKVAVDHISHIVAEPMEGMPVADKTAL